MSHRTTLPLILLIAASLFVGPMAASADVGSDVLEALKKGLRSDDLEQKTKAIIDVGRLSGQLSPAQKKAAAAQLNRAFGKATDTEVRRTMVRALARLRHENGWVPVINAALEDKTDLVRKTARLEVFAGRSDMLEVLQTLIGQEKNAAYKSRLILLIGDRRKHDAVPFLITLLADRETMVKTCAAEALEAITKQPLGYSAKRWAGWRKVWEKRKLAKGDTGPSVAPEHEEGKEPEPHATRSLHPDFYGLRIRSKDVVFVVDISGSVGSTGVQDAKRELVKAVESLGSDVSIAALFFSEKVHFWKDGQMVKATPDNKADLAFFLRGLEPGRKTDVFSAFNAGLKIIDRRVEELAKLGIERKRPATLLAVSDGQDNVRGVPMRIIEERLDRLDLERAQVHSIVLGGKHNKLMRMLAHYGSGKYILVPR